MTHPFQARQANHDGFVYVTNRLKFYEAFEPTLLSADGDTKESLSASVANLYQATLAFQLKTVLRCYKSSVKRLYSDVREPQSWTNMIDKIKTLKRRSMRTCKRLETAPR